LLLQCGHTTGTVLLLRVPFQPLTEHHSSNLGTRCEIALAYFARPTHLADPRVQLEGWREREKVPSPQPWLQGALSLFLAIRLRFYGSGHTRTVLFCTFPQIFSITLRNTLHPFTLCLAPSSASRPPLSPRPSLRPTCATKTKQIVNVY
jgi:hypothetical protein